MYLIIEMICLYPISSCSQTLTTLDMTIFDEFERLRFVIKSLGQAICPGCKTQKTTDNLYAIQKIH